jgi:ABC-2 type transport system permease protein
MNTQSNPVPQSSLLPQGLESAVVAALRPLYWSIRRELWENRSIYIAPLVAATVFLVGFALKTVAVRRQVSMSALDAAQIQDLLTSRYELSASLIMGIALLVGIFYSLDALYGERRDRSILFWKSLPVSDVNAVLSKLTIPILILPVLSFAITVATQFLMLLLSSALLAGSGVSIAALWTQVSFLHVSSIWLYHLLTVHGLWYAPFYGWLLMVSAWAPRAPFMWAFLPGFVIWGVEKLTFNTSHFLNLMQYRLLGPGGSMSQGHHSEDFLATLIPHHFFNNPDLWTGLVVAAAFLYATVRLRRSRGPI